MNKRKGQERKRIRETRRSLETYRENSNRVRKQNGFKIKTTKMFDDKGRMGLEIDSRGRLKSLAPLFKDTDHEVVGLWEKAERDDRDVTMFDLMADLENEIGYLVE